MRRSIALLSMALPQQWLKVAQKEIKKDPKSLIVHSINGFDIYPLYLPPPGVEGAGLPGFFPYTRGVHATMYTAKP